MEPANQTSCGLSQEGLKIIACVTMFIDHMAATLVLGCVDSAPNPRLVLTFYYMLRIIGRLAFPIYCFLLVEGAHHTRNSRKYALRLAIGAVLAEIPYDLVHAGRIDFASSSVMVTLFLGYGMILLMERVPGFWKAAAVVPFYFLAEWLNTDYAGKGILLIAVLALTRGVPHEKLWRAAGFLAVLLPGKWFNIGYFQFPVNQCAVFGLIPIACYDGRKLTHSRAAQWAFYLFYPAHLLLLWLLKVLIFG